MHVLYNPQLFRCIPQLVHVYLDDHRGSCSNLIASSHQSTPLHLAAGGGHVHTVQWLVMAGADLNIKEDDGVSERDNSTDSGLMHQR